MIYQIPGDQITGLAKYGLPLSCTAVSDLAESDLEKYVPPRQSAGNGPSPHLPTPASPTGSNSISIILTNTVVKGLDISKQTLETLPLKLKVLEGHFPLVLHMGNRGTFCQ